MAQRRQINLLNPVRRILRTEEDWCKGATRRSKRSGRALLGATRLKPEECSYCLLGAIRQAYPDDPDTCNRIIRELRRRAGKALGYDCDVAIPVFNDAAHITFAKVRGLLKQPLYVPDPKARA